MDRYEKKNEVRGIIILIAVVVIFLCVALLIPFDRTGTYWTGFAFGIVGILLSAVGMILAFGKKSVKSRFYGWPIAKVALAYVLIQFIASVITMSLAHVSPAWPWIIISVILLILAVLGLIATDATRDEIERQDVQQKVDTETMIALKAKSRVIVGLCKDAELETAVEKLAEDFKYSDPVSSEATKELEAELAIMLDEILQAVLDGNKESVQDMCKKAHMQLEERNRICRLKK